MKGTQGVYLSIVSFILEDEVLNSEPCTYETSALLLSYLTYKIVYFRQTWEPERKKWDRNLELLKEGKEYEVDMRRQNNFSGFTFDFHKYYKL